MDFVSTMEKEETQMKKERIGIIKLKMLSKSKGKSTFTLIKIYIYLCVCIYSLNNVQNLE